MRQSLVLLFALAAAGPALAQGTSMVVALPGDPGHLNPGISTASPIHAVADSLFNGLVALDRDANPVPDLAAAWTISEDGTRYRFNLAPNAQWHDGKPVTAADVKFSFEDVLLKYHARTRASLAAAVDAITAIDDRTIDIALKRPYPALLRQLDVTEAPILPRHIYAGEDPNKHPANLKPVGSGPYRFVSYAKDDSVVLARNDAYFKAAAPKIDRVVFRIIPEAATQVSALLAGEVDYIGRLSGADIPRVKEKGFTLVNTTSGPGGANCIMTVGFNLERKPLQDRRVREAFARAIDRQQLLDRVAFGQGRVAAAPIGSGIRWAHLPGALAAYKVQPEAANRLLDEAGLARGSEGTRATLDMVHFPQFARWSDLMRQHLAQVGIALRVRTQDPAAFGKTVFSDRDFDLTLISYCNGADPEIGVRRMYHSAAIGNVPFSNAAAYRNAAVDAAFDKAGSSTEAAARTEAYRAIQRQVAEDLPYWWLVETDFTAVHSPRFTGLSPWSGQFAETVASVR